MVDANEEAKKYGGNYVIYQINLLLHCTRKPC